MIDLAPNHLETVRRILAEHMPDCEVRAFGSRAKWEGQDYSDLDLAVVCEHEADGRAIERLKQAFKDSDLPIRVDVLDWHDIAEDFRKAIESDCVVVQAAAETANWLETTFGSCASLIQDTISPSDCGETPYIGLEHIGEGTLSLESTSTERTVNSIKSRFRCGDILFGKLRPYFRKVVRPRFDGICSTDIWVVRPLDGVDAGYLFYLMASQQFVDTATRGSQGTRMPRAKWEFVSRSKVFLPPIQEQRAIAGVLGALDDKIELNRCMSETLEEMAQAMFRSWFVDFDPVRAKVEGRTSGLPPDLDALFPAEFEESELGEIPAGWQVKELQEVIEVNPQRTIRRGELVTHVEMAAVPTRGPQVKAWTYREYTSGSRFMDGDTLFGRITPSLENGKTALVDFLDHDEVGWGSTEFIVLRPRPPWPPEYAYIMARDARFRNHAIVNMTGTSGRQRVPADIISAYRMPIPDDDVVVTFGQLVQPWFESTTILGRQSDCLAEQRDALLPRLLSGKLRMGDAQRSVSVTV